MSARQTLAIKKFGRTVSFLDGEAPMNAPADSLNAKLHGLTYKPRDGYNEGYAAPSANPFTWLGLDHVINGTGTREFISVENRNGTINAYSRHITTLAPTVLGSLTLASGDWFTTYFGDSAYLINPSGTKRVYEHVIGTSSSLVVLEDTAYTPTPDTELTITAVPLTQRGYDAGDTWTYTSTDGIDAGAAFNNSSGVVTVVATDNSNGPFHQTQFQNLFVATQDWTAYRAIAVPVKSLAHGTGSDGDGAGVDIFNAFRVTNVSPEIRTNGVWRVIASTDFKETISVNADEVTVEIYTRGLTDINDVEGIRFTIGGVVNRFGSPNACTLYPIKLGGTYLESTVNTQRLWDGTLVGDGITYGFRYKKAGPLYSSFAQGSIDADQGHGFSPSTATSAAPLGGRISLSVPVATAGSYTDVEFVRLMEDDVTWKIIATVANSGIPQFMDVYSEYDLAALTTATGITDTPIQPTPPLSLGGAVYAFPFKQSMVWLCSGGESNIKISRVGNPKETYDADVTYDADDLTQPANRTLADNQGDQPVWGVQAGANAFMCGSQAAYAMQGDFPVSMSPSRQIPGSRGIAGKYAGCRFRPTNGEDGAAYMDPEGNLWLVNSVPQFVADTRSRPYELSSVVRHKIKQFLYNDQLGEFPTISMSDVHLKFMEPTGSLWCILGKRAAIFRQDESGTGWEFYEFTLTSNSTVEACRDFTPGTGTPTSVARAGSTDAWTTPAYGGVDDTDYATASMTFGDKTELLRSAGIAPGVLLPVSSTVTEIHIRGMHKAVGDIPVTHDWTKLVVSATPSGSDVAEDEVLTSEFTEFEYIIDSGLPSVANINAALVGYESAYLAEAADAAALTGSNFTITPSGATSALFTGTVNYIGGGTAPSFVYVDITSRVTVNGQTNPPATPSADPEMYATANNGLTGGTGSGTIYPTDTPLVVETTERVRVTLTVGAGSFSVTRSGTAEPLPGTVNWIPDITYTGSAAFSSYVPSVVSVDNMEISYCYELASSASSGISWQKFAFTADGRYIAGRSPGQLDIVEYDFRTGLFIGGDGRDGGYQMPDWYITLQRMTFEGHTARMNGVQVNTLSGDDDFTVEDKMGDQAFVGSTSTGQSTSRWVKFPVSQIGISHQIKVSGDESVTGIDGLAVQYQISSRSKVK